MSSEPAWEDETPCGHPRQGNVFLVTCPSALVEIPHPKRPGKTKLVIVEDPTFGLYGALIRECMTCGGQWPVHPPIDRPARRRLKPVAASLCTPRGLRAGEYEFPDPMAYHQPALSKVGWSFPQQSESKRRNLSYTCLALHNLAAQFINRPVAPMGPPRGPGDA